MATPFIATYSFTTSPLSIYTSDLLSPEVLFTIPSQNAVNVDLNSSIFIRIGDDSAEADQVTINVLINGTPVITNGVFQTGFTGSILVNIVKGYDILISPDVAFSTQQLVTVQVDCNDLALNIMPTFRWYFYTEGYSVSLTPSGGNFNSPTSVTMSDNGSNSVLHYTDDDTSPSPGNVGTITISPPNIYALPSDSSVTVLQLLGIETVSYTTIPVSHQKDNATIRLWQLDDVGSILTDDSSSPNDLNALNATSVAALIGLGRQFSGSFNSRAYSNTDISWPDYGCIEFWYKPDNAINALDERFYSAAIDAPESADAYRFGRSNEALFMEDVAGASTLTTLPLIWDSSRFYHIAFVWDNITSFRRIYRNGVLAAQDTGLMSTTVSLFGEMIGHSHSGVSGFQTVGTQGILDSFKFSDKIRSSNQIARDYLQGVVQQIDLFVPSVIVRNEYIVDIQFPVTTIAPSGVFRVPTVVTLTTDQENSMIYYTTNGAEPLAPGDVGYPGDTLEGVTPVSFLVSQEGSTEIKAFSIDPSGNRETL